MTDTQRTAEAEIEHFSGTILKLNKDGVETMSSTLEPGETLLSGNAASEVEEAQPELDQKTTPTLSRAQAAQNAGDGTDGETTSLAGTDTDKQPVTEPAPAPGAEEAAKATEAEIAAKADADKAADSSDDKVAGLPAPTKATRSKASSAS